MIPCSPSAASTASTRSSAYGGSRKTTSKGPSRRGSTRSTSPWITRARAASLVRVRFSRITAQATGLRSTSTAASAPRLSASIASAPVPAYRSSTRCGCTPIEASIEKIAPRTLSEVGRVASPLGAFSGKPRASPAMTRMVPAPQRVAVGDRAGVAVGLAVAGGPARRVMRWLFTTRITPSPTTKEIV